MKTTNKTNRACKMATVLMAALVYGTVLMAQSQPDANTTNDVNEALERLNALVVSTEQSLRYTAPMDVYDDIRAAYERLEWIAQKTELEIRYRAPELEQENAVEFAENENAEEIEAKAFLTYKPDAE
jgi:hypothetical protein